MLDHSGLGLLRAEQADHQHQRNDGYVLHEENGQAEAAAQGIDFAAFHKNAHDHRRGTECHDGTHRNGLGKCEPGHQQRSNDGQCGRHLKRSPAKSHAPHLHQSLE
jgi:hypothetical protein